VTLIQFFPSHWKHLAWSPEQATDGIPPGSRAAGELFRLKDDRVRCGCEPVADRDCRLPDAYRWCPGTPVVR
jgi:hypothetical protein